MGHGYSFKCPNCKSKINLHEGVGILYHYTFERLFFGEKPELKEEVPKEIWEACISLMENGWKPKDYEYQICFCPKCKTLEQYTSFTLEKDGETYTPKFICKSCGTELQKCNPLEMDIPFSITCAECNTTFTARPNPCVVKWD
ncbi:MAG TPA: hypothetical protein O0X21_03725 [Methanocorpusculum sp.]|jgi:hypothetical protein|nr:hypothetical protein [Methanocorpusculum sp.]MEE1135644.1 hypothetical protein [Methanocorpusculum sp.]HJJ67460.1 hypothetical protein [Methanocorpusculum sp.]HJJ70302.1 hypothetical protein [Methanocorpusculum sp.]HJJ73977.1 hypothetical protein [Methanocorpusculum sp.]